MIAFYIILGLIMGILKVLIESFMWDKEKDERKFHGIGLGIVFGALIIEYVLTDYSLLPIIITWLIYWNTFEIVNNMYHNKDFFYVGETANFDKLLRWSTKYHERLKFFIQLVTILIVVIIFLHL